MTDRDCRVTTSAGYQNEGHGPVFNLVTEMVNNGSISESSDCPIWALISKHNSEQLRVEPRNGFVCFLGMDATSCELVFRSTHGDSTIDGRQALLVYANGSFHLKDLNSSYGVSNDAQRCTALHFSMLINSLLLSFPDLLIINQFVTFIKINHQLLLIMDCHIIVWKVVTSLLMVVGH